MSKSLTHSTKAVPKITSPGSPEKRLTSRTSVPFKICFRYRLLNGYTVKDLKQRHLQDLHKFLCKVANQDFDVVDSLYKRETDRHDIYNEQQIIHYEVTKTFRLHGIIEDSVFVVLRIDPNHQVHS